MSTKYRVEGLTSTDNGYSVPPENLVIIGLDTQDGPEHPLYDERILMPLSEDLINNYVVFGREQSIVVRVRREDDRDIMEVRSGRRGVRYLREANKRLVAAGGKPKKVLVIIRNSDDDGALAAGVMRENEAREEDAFEAKARKAQRLEEQFGYGAEDIARECGVSVQTAISWLAVKALDPTVREKVRTKKIAGSGAVALAKLPPAKQREVVERLEKKAAANGKERISLRDVRAETTNAAIDHGYVAPPRGLLREFVALRPTVDLPAVAHETLAWVTGMGPEPEWVRDAMKANADRTHEGGTDAEASS